MTGTCFAICLVLAAGCRDSQEQRSLQMCKDDLATQRRNMDTHLATISELKSELSGAQTKIQDLSKENEKLKAREGGADAVRNKPPRSNATKAPRKARH